MALVQEFPRAHRGEDRLVFDREIATHEQECPRPAQKKRLHLNDVAGARGFEKLHLHREGDRGCSIGRIKNGGAKRKIGKRRQHAAVQNAAAVDVALIDPDGKRTAASRSFFEDRPDMDFERIGKRHWRESRQRTRQIAHALGTTFHKPVAMSSVRTSATSSPERNTTLRARRRTRTRASILSPNRAGLTKSQLSAIVLNLEVPDAPRAVLLIATSMKLISIPP